MKPQVELGTRYYSGDGVPNIFVEAVKWYRLAAEQGDAGRQYCFGVKYDTGHGVPQNMVEACARFLLLPRADSQMHSQNEIEPRAN